MERNVFSGGDNTSICASGMASSGVRLAFDLQRFADTEVVAVEVGEGKVTLTLPDLSSMAKDDTITLQDRAGNIYGTIKDQNGGTEQITLDLNENSSVTHIDFTGINTTRKVKVQNAGEVVCTISDGTNRGTYKINCKDCNYTEFNAKRDTIPSDKELTLLDGVINLPKGFDLPDLDVEISTSLTLKGMWNYVDKDWTGTLTIEPCADITEGYICRESTGYCYQSYGNASFTALKGCYVTGGNYSSFYAGSNGASGKAAQDGKISVNEGDVVLFAQYNEIAIDAGPGGVTASWEESMSLVDSARRTYQFAAGAKASMNSVGGRLP
ncbi:MAG: hypothetical protein IKO94_05915 [Selenomonadaceae bacterium]|nr:hypothetical protein [Selenomonadaceae bacterium]